MQQYRNLGYSALTPLNPSAVCAFSNGVFWPGHGLRAFKRAVHCSPYLLHYARYCLSSLSEYFAYLCLPISVCLCLPLSASVCLCLLLSAFMCVVVLCPSRSHVRIPCRWNAIHVFHHHRKGLACLVTGLYTHMCANSPTPTLSFFTIPLPPLIFT
jgi:hypothetical protein